MEQLLEALRNFLDNIPPLSSESSRTLNISVFFIQWAAIILSELTGIYDARKYKMDFYGCLVVGMIVAVGGGTVRDLLLGRQPVFWLESPAYVITVIVVGIPALFIVTFQKITQKWSKLYLVTDSLGLGLWAYLGTLYALQMEVNPVVAPILGIITASFGGVLRDVIFNRIPQTFMPGQLYVAAAAIGAVVYTILWWSGVSETAAFLVCFGLTFCVRLVFIRFNVRSR